MSYELLYHDSNKSNVTHALKLADIENGQISRAKDVSKTMLSQLDDDIVIYVLAFSLKYARETCIA